MIRVFPVAAPTTISNDFGSGRSGGRGHAGNDLFADPDAPLVAVDDGELRSGVDPLGGNILNLYSDDGARYYYAHLSWFALPDGQMTNAPPAPRRVRAGDVVGFLGRTGNAATTQHHLHFEEHPGRGAAIDPFPALDRAPRVEPNQQLGGASSRTGTDLSFARALVLASVGGALVWAAMNPSSARRVVRRLAW